MNNLVRNIKNAMPTTLSFIAVGGVIGTAVMAAFDTPKALKLLEEAKEEKLSKPKTVLKVAPAYARTAGVAAGTVLCVLGANVLNKRKQASMAGAYALLSQSYSSYRGKVREKIGDEEEKKIHEEVKEEMKVTNKGESLIHVRDVYNDRCFDISRADFNDVKYCINRIYVSNGYASLNDLYKLLGLADTDVGDKYGWSEDDWSFTNEYFIDMYLADGEPDNGVPTQDICFSFGPHACYVPEYYD